MNKTPLSIIVSASLFGTILWFPLLGHAAAPADPFVKDAGSGSATKAAAGGPWQNCMLVLEVYVLDKEEGLSILESEHGSAARYRRVTDLMKNGKARLEILTALNNKSGQRAMVEASDEVVHPVTFQTRNAGDSLEFEPAKSADGRTYDLQIEPQRIAFLGFRDLPGTSSVRPAQQPRFSVQSIITGSHLLVNEPQYLGSFNPPGDLGAVDGGLTEMWLAFTRINVTGPTADDLKRPARPLDWSALNLDYTFYSLDRAAARDILAAAPSVDGPWKALEMLLREKKARFEHLTSVKCKSEERSVTEEALEDSRRAPEMGRIVQSPVAQAEKTKQGATRGDGKAGPDGGGIEGMPVGLEMRKAGVSIEVEPMVAPDGVSIDVNMFVQSVTRMGELKAAAPSPGQPVFEVRKITTSETVLAGRHMLVGTFNPPGADGVNDRADSGRTWFVFVRATPNEP